MTPEKEHIAAPQQEPNQTQNTIIEEPWLVRGVDIIPPNSHRTTPRPTPLSELAKGQTFTVAAEPVTSRKESWLD